ncbi:MAG TPA: membrane protein insertase YidC [Gemmatimonadaceae bacterium]|nr:membrane protein insertase YidC [Gemmatimonadaceae bacterium]
MDKRFFLALVLTALVILGPSFFLRPPPEARDTTSLAPRPSPDEPASEAPTPVAPGAPATPAGDAAPPRTIDVRSIDTVPGQPARRLVGDTTVVTTPLATYRFSSLGASPTSIELRNYQALGSGVENDAVELIRPGDRALGLRVLAARDTISLDTIPFALDRSTDEAGNEILTYSASAGPLSVRLRYTIVPDNYLIHLDGDIRGFTPPAFLLIDLPRGLRSQEADTLDDHRHLAYVYKPRSDDATSITFDALDPGTRRMVPGPHTWVATKTKYFLIGLLAPDDRNLFAELHVAGGPRISRVATEAEATVVRTLTDGTFSVETYAGPQEWRRLHAMGRDFENVNPYGWRFLQGVIQPFATIVMRVLLWMRDTLQINYGWILVIFGVAVRLLLWPLNQRAMRASLQIQRLQPQLAEVQKRHANNPEKLREEMMKVYKEHGMSPLSPLMGCLPMLLPMPIFFALFFVFQNTIEFRGVSFLWLPDISLKDPLYVLPILMGASMFLLSYIGMRSAPPNPQTKLMTYIFPLMFTAILFNFASGLNLYYFVQNMAAIPQQWLIARERSRAAPAPAVRPA